MSRNVFSAAATSKVEALEKTLKDREADLAKAKSAAVQAVDKANAAEDRANKAEAEATEAKKKLAGAEARANKAEAEATEAKKKLAGAEARADKAEAEATEAKKKLAEAEARANKAEAKLAEAEAKATKAKAAEVDLSGFTPEERSQLEGLAIGLNELKLTRDQLIESVKSRSEAIATLFSI